MEQEYLRHHHHHYQGPRTRENAPPVENIDDDLTGQQRNQPSTFRKVSLISGRSLPLHEQSDNRPKFQSPSSSHRYRRRVRSPHEDDDMQKSDNNIENDDEKRVDSSTPTNNHLPAVAQCLALEQAYVHDVYARIAKQCRHHRSSLPIRPHIKEFLFEGFESGSIILDVGCGDGTYVGLNPELFTVGLERCPEWFMSSKKSNDVDDVLHHHSRVTQSMNETQPQPPPMIITASRGNVMLGDMIHVPFRDESVDGILCCGVIHHVSTTERRIRALRELARILRIGGKVLITVWAFEGREVNNQDVLIKWKKRDSFRRSSSLTLKERNLNRHKYRSTSSHSFTSSSFEFSSSDNNDDDDTTSISSDSATSTSHRGLYETSNSPTSEFGSCYSFVRSLLKFNPISPSSFYYPNTASIRKRTTMNNFSTTISRRSSDTFQNTSSTRYVKDAPIELPNIDDPDLYSSKTFQQRNYNNSNPLINSKFANFSKKEFSYSTATGIRFSRDKRFSCSSSLQQGNSSTSRRNSLKEQYESFVSTIREHILSSTKTSTTTTKSISNVFRHRFSLPIVSFPRISTDLSQINNMAQQQLNNNCPEDRVCSHSVAKNISSSNVSTHSTMPYDRKLPPHPKIDEVDSRQSSFDVVKETELKNGIFVPSSLATTKSMTGTSTSTTSTATNTNNSSTTTSTTSTTTNYPKRKSFGRSSLHRSFSSDSIDSSTKHSRQQSINTESVVTNTTTTNTNSVSDSGTSTSSHLVAYYSMPELRALEERSSSQEESMNPPINMLRSRKPRPKITDLHPITFLEEVEKVSLSKNLCCQYKRESSQDTEAAIDEMEMMFQSIEHVPNILNKVTSSIESAQKVLPPQTTRRDYKNKLYLNLNHLHPILSTNEDYDCDDERDDESIDDDGKNKTQRSSSVEYKAKISPSYRTNLRRFSYSPSTKPLVQSFSPEEISTTQDEPHPSVDSEESFVTIIPANRSCRGSVNDVPIEDNGSKLSFLDDVIFDVDGCNVHNGVGVVPTLDIPIDESNRLELTPAHIRMPRNPPNSRIGGRTKSVETTSETTSYDLDDNDDRDDDDNRTTSSRTTTTTTRDSSKLVTPTTSHCSTPSPLVTSSTSLHRYFHLFRCGELEDLIANNVENLNVVRSFIRTDTLNKHERIFKHCIICEKIRVWTI